MTISVPGRGFVLAAPSSGCGKTVLTLALLRAFKNLGHRVAGAKIGPDFIDPRFHYFACGAPSYNLDPWAMDAARLAQLLVIRDRQLLIIEAMMGLFDGAADGTGSAADLAGEFDLPVVLVVDCARQSHSIAALVNGFSGFRTDVCVAGVILNKVGSARHEKLLRDALVGLKMPVFGVVYRDEALALPDRHLGLVQADEHLDLMDFIETASKIVEDSCDLDALANLASPLPSQHEAAQSIRPLGQRIAVARDQAFMFAYPHLIRDWQEQGAEISYFSPLADEVPVPDCDAVYLPGGYPELHAGKIGQAGQFKAGLHAASHRGATIYGECGGYMVMGDGLVDADGARHDMCGLFRLETSFQKRKLHLGYRKASSPGFLLGNQLNCHEFHYSMALKEEGEKLFSVTDANGVDLGDVGLRNGKVFGSYMHLIEAIA